MLLAACRVSCSRKVTVLRICSCGYIYLCVFSSIAAAGWCKQSNTHSLRSLVVTNIWWGWGQRKVLSSQLGSSAFCLLECFDTFGLITVKAAGPLKACSTYPQRFSFRLLEKRTKRCWLTWKMLLKWRSWSFSCFQSHNAIDWASGRQLYTKTTLSIYRAFFSTCWRMELLRWMWKIAAKLFSVHVCMVTQTNSNAAQAICDLICITREQITQQVDQPTSPDPLLTAIESWVYCCDLFPTFFISISLFLLHSVFISSLFLLS